MYHFAHIPVRKIPRGGIFALKDLWICTFDIGLINLHTQEECNRVRSPQAIHHDMDVYQSLG